MSSKWANTLSTKCKIDPYVLKVALEELTESCYADAPTAKRIIEELTLRCFLNEQELRKFIRDVSKNCPTDAKKLEEEVINAEGKKEEAFKAIDRAGKDQRPA